MKNLFLLFVTSVSAALAAPSDHNVVVATILGKAIYADSIELKFDAMNQPILPQPGTPMPMNRNPLDKLILQALTMEQDAWVRDHHLQPTLQELKDYQSFAKKNEAKQIENDKSTLNIIDRTLKGKNISASQRVELQEQKKATTARLANDQQQLASESGYSETQMRTYYGADVGRWKFFRDLYRHFGGELNSAPFGMIPVTAIERVMKELESQGQIQIYDPSLMAAFWQRLAKKAPTPVPQSAIDWTPFWKKTKK